MLSVRKADREILERFPYPLHYNLNFDSMIFNPQFPTFLNVPPVKRAEDQLRPGSKSLQLGRFLAALCRETRLHHLAPSDDTRYIAKDCGR